MTCFKIIRTEDGSVHHAEAAETPAFVRFQARPPCLLLCRERDAEGIVSARDDDTLYALKGKTLTGAEKGLYARKISLAEYVEYIQQEGEEESEEISDAEALAIIMGVRTE